MNTKDFDFYLPEHLIAQKPSGKRGEDKLLLLDKKTGAFSDRQFSELPDILPPNALMVFNNSKVRRARVYAKSKDSGAQTEFLLIDSLDDGRLWQAMTKKAKRQRIGKTFLFDEGVEAMVVEPPANTDTSAEFRWLQFNTPITDSWLETHGHIPLPPYIRREDTEEDASRYQTVYAQTTGSIAAPTAGLHFTDEILQRIDARGIERTAITLHVGLGTFLPVRTEKIEEHRMHTEKFFITDTTATAIEKAKREGRPIIAVGTTSVRSLESAWNPDTQRLMRGSQSTNIFIYPPYQFKLVDMLFTNFHTPESTLLMLVSALAGKDQILAAYAHAVEQEYRFFSYGDAMFIR
ncbi:tRNA preQ1(34) S-adenosylmethionine ribosyltransferase-isomerase QueA [Treponema phagedenis]|uniref:tRNA preQ1(34) S-adenosylmethionine ribosyltransferase-isomerase QueA n=1 Tax=Treponema phagedenis TaxID=162 RepID=UPI0001F63CF7|nr:tRNA preQ1(34) S-adenosylmethionine ribosyltransferase-isomerase QueA [Treponema phagedenis]EFW37566.1 S-adenosylmethionine:tRNA ribosyltransferase-isomerase [Treponema phagedenis F0421]TYT79241.1 tRNA preQ1(34) S-adenosylmethionine ribosyltransferase-isomerase QueA [Treponema phagedenis]